MVINVLIIDMGTKVNWVNFHIVMNLLNGT